MWTITETCSNREFQRWELKLPFAQNFRISSWSYHKEGHAKKCVERYCELAKKMTQQLYKVSTTCIDDHQFKEEEMPLHRTRMKSLKLTTSCLHGKYGVEIKFWSLNGDITHSWVRISQGSNRFVMGSNNNVTEVLEDQPDEQALKLVAKDFACRSKRKSKTTKNGTCWLFTEYHSDERKELD